MSIKYVKGDLFEGIKNHKNVVICHCCNNIGVFGAGFVIPLAKHFPKARTQYLKWFDMMDAIGEKLPLGCVDRVDCSTDNQKISVMNMIGQEGVGTAVGKRPPIRYACLVDCMREVRHWVYSNNYLVDEPYTICAPKFGSGFAGGSWPFIETLIGEIWGDFKVEIYYL